MSTEYNIATLAQKMSRNYNLSLFRQHTVNKYFFFVYQVYKGVLLCQAAGA